MLSLCRRRLRLRLLCTPTRSHPIVVRTPAVARAGGCPGVRAHARPAPCPIVFNRLFTSPPYITLDPRTCDLTHSGLALSHILILYLVSQVERAERPVAAICALQNKD